MVPLGELRSVQVVGYGITRPGEHIGGGVGMIRAADVKDGQLRADDPRRIDPGVHEANLRSRLEEGDVVVVLVGRVGEAAVVTRDFQDWNASRTVAILRTPNPDEAAWLCLWLGSPEVRDWCERQATGSTLQRTLSLAALRSLPVPVPPPGPRAALLRATRLLAAKTATNVRIAECATELSDARFACEARNSESWPEQSIAAWFTSQPEPHDARARTTTERIPRAVPLSSLLRTSCRATCPTCTAPSGGYPRARSVACVPRAPFLSPREKTACAS